jgi:hypothetical protein
MNMPFRFRAEPFSRQISTSSTCSTASKLGPAFVRERGLQDDLDVSTRYRYDHIVRKIPRDRLLSEK